MKKKQKYSPLKNKKIIFPKNLSSTSFPKSHHLIIPKLKRSLNPKKNLSFFPATTMASSKQLEVQSEDRAPQKWCISLREDKFENILSQGNPTVNKVFGDGSFFSPYLFRKFFDPSDAFPLWEFESDILLSHLRSSGQTAVDWAQTDKEYVVKAEIPGVGKNSVKVYVENGKVVEISGLWKHQRDPTAKEWRGGHWWEHGFVRRLELPENADWRRIEASLTDEIYLEIRIPKGDIPRGKEEGAAHSE